MAENSDGLLLDIIRCFFTSTKSHSQITRPSLSLLNCDIYGGRLYICERSLSIITKCSPLSISLRQTERNLTPYGAENDFVVLHD